MQHTYLLQCWREHEAGQQHRHENAMLVCLHCLLSMTNHTAGEQIPPGGHVRHVLALPGGLRGVSDAARSAFGEEGQQRGVDTSHCQNMSRGGRGAPNGQARGSGGRLHCSGPCLPLRACRGELMSLHTCHYQQQLVLYMYSIRLLDAMCGYIIIKKPLLITLKYRWRHHTTRQLVKAHSPRLPWNTE